MTVGYSAAGPDDRPEEAAVAHGAVQAPDTTFRHGSHTDFECLECHTMQTSHGARLIQDVSDCRSCHHVQERVDQECSGCHVTSPALDSVHLLQRSFTLTARDGPVDREVRFQHLAHQERECVECHTEGPSYAVPDLDCQGCHEEHHTETTVACWSCHLEPADDVHTPAVHQTCSGSGCHVDGPIQGPPQDRVGCLWCHTEQVDHEPQGECVDCHTVSA